MANRRSRFWFKIAQRRRLVQILSTLAINSYVTQWTTKGFPCPAFNCYACPAASFACPIGTIQHFITRGKVPLYVLGVVGLFGAVIGRASCGWFCPFGLIQDLLYKIPVPKWRLRNRFNWSRYVFLAILVVVIPFITHETWFCKLCPAGMLEGGIPMVLLEPGLQPLIGTLYWAKLGILVTFLGWMSVTRRPFCRWVCPLGALWSPFNPVSSLRLSVDEERCIECDRCREVCPVDIRVYDSPHSAACIRCLACVDECPAECITVQALNWTLESDRSAA
jgi:polyferredoxin